MPSQLTYSPHMQRGRRMIPSILSLVALVTLLLASATASAQVLPTGSTVDGKTIGEWGAEFWTYILSHPAAILPLGDDPLTDQTGEFQAQGQSGPVWFMCPAAGPATGAAVTRTFDVPAGKHILVPLFTVGGIPDLGEDPTELCDVIVSIVDQTDALLFTLDGAPPLTEPELFTHREPSPRFVPITVGVDNFFGLIPGTYPNSCSDGYFLMLEPLPPGPHEIRCGGSNGNTQIDITNDVGIAAAVPALVPSALIGLLASLAAGGVLILRKGMGRKPNG